MAENNNPNGSTNDQPEKATQSLEELQAELARLKDENGRLKNAQSNASADASKYKKALQERMTEQERVANETKELIERLKTENETLKRNETHATHTSGFVGLGFDAELARKAAGATVNIGNDDFLALTASIKDFIIAHDKALQADALRNTPRPGAGAVVPAVTKEQFDGMTYAERLKIFTEQPDLYKELTK